MPPRPFPHALNLGTDICHVPRFAKYLLPRHPQPARADRSASGGAGESAGGGDASSQPLFRLFDKFLLPTEQRAFWSRFGPLSALRDTADKRRGAVCWIAGRWAAKEAIVKAHAPNRRVLLRHILVCALPSGQPYGVVLDNEKPPGAPREAERVYRAWRAGRAAVPEVEAEVEPGFGPGRALGGDARATEDVPDGPDAPGADGHADGQVVRLSISHDGEYCTAVALAPVGVTVPELGL